MDREVLGTIADFIARSFLFEEDGSALDHDASLFDTGVLNSTDVLELVSFIQETWGFEVEDAELVPENFETISRIAGYVGRKISG